MGTEWPFKPTNEEYKSGTELIKMLLEVCAKGGNLLLNIGPDPDGVIPFEQTAPAARAGVVALRQRRGDL